MKHPKNQFCKSILDGDRVSSPFLVKYSAVATGKTGKPYMNVVLTDQTGDVEARIFDQVPKYSSQIVKDAFVLIEGQAQVFNNRIQILIKEATLLREDEVELEAYLPINFLNPDKIYSEIVGLIESMQDPHYQALMKSILIEDQNIIDLFKRAPAAKSMHHAYPSGLIEHVLSIVKTLDFLSKLHAPYLNRDLLFVGGFLHDLGKIWELQFEKTTDYTTVGRLVGHLVMGSDLIDQKIRYLIEAKKIEEFPEEKRLLAKHVVLAHHGKLEYGSPKEPACLEALVVHMVDDLDSKINAMRVFIENDPNPGAWTLLNKQFERFLYKPEWARKK